MSDQDQTAKVTIPEQATAQPEVAETTPTLDRYVVGGELGRGGMGRVLEAQDHELLRQVALKIVHSPDPLDAHRFVVEAQITGQLDHPNVLPVYDLGNDPDGNPYFTMKLIREHVSLRDVIQGLADEDPAYASYTYRRRVQIIQQVCHALSYAHKRGVVHRDIKPDNIVVGPYGEVYVVDWGVSRVTGDGDVQVDELEAEVLEAAEQDLIVGTPLYMAPEQIMSGQTGVRADLYSLSVVMFELLTLRHYLEGVTDFESLREAVISQRRTPAERYLNPGHGRVPRSLSRVCARGIALDPEVRFKSADELRCILQLYLEGKSPVVCPGTCLQRTLNMSNELIDQRPVLLPLALVLLGATLLGWVIFTTRYFLTH